MNKPIHPAVAEHVMEENEKLRGLLLDIGNGCARRDMPSEQVIAEGADRIEAALSRQTEPAPAQDSIGLVLEEMRERRINHGKHTSPTLEAWANRIEALTRPAQTEQQPEQSRMAEALGAFVSLAEDRLHELGALSPEMAECLTNGRAALSAQGADKV